MSKLGRNRGDKGYVYVTTKDGVRKKLDKRSDEYKAIHPTPEAGTGGDAANIPATKPNGDPIEEEPLF